LKDDYRKRAAIYGNPPRIGENITIRNTISGNLQILRATTQIKDPFIKNLWHIGFTSSNPAENTFDIGDSINGCLIKSYRKIICSSSKPSRNEYITVENSNDDIIGRIVTSMCVAKGEL